MSVWHAIAVSMYYVNAWRFGRALDARLSALFDDAQPSTRTHVRPPPGWSSRDASALEAALQWDGERMPPELALRILDVSEGASISAIRSAHRKLALRYHPDRLTRIMAAVNVARDTLLGASS